MCVNTAVSSNHMLVAFLMYGYKIYVHWNFLCRCKWFFQFLSEMVTHDCIIADFVEKPLVEKNAANAFWITTDVYVL